MGEMLMSLIVSLWWGILGGYLCPLLRHLSASYRCEELRQVDEITKASAATQNNSEVILWEGAKYIYMTKLSRKNFVNAIMGPKIVATDYCYKWEAQLQR